jgi:hypothetical protein
VGKAPKTLPVVDTDFLFMKLREKSIGAIIPVDITVGKKKYTAEVDLRQLEVQEFPGHSPNIKLSDDLAVTMNYLTYDNSRRITEAAPEFQEQATYDMIRESINLIITTSNTYTFKDYTIEEQKEFFDTLRPEQIAKLKEFFTTQPKLIYKIRYQKEDGSFGIHEVDKIGDFF